MTKRTREERLREIEKVIDEAGWISCKDIAAALHVNFESIRYYLNLLVSTGAAETREEVVEHMDSKASSRRFIYRLVSPKGSEAPIPATPPAYRNLRLSENLTDYDRTNHAFAALCMSTRKS
jgi:hypothetical protein